MTRDQRYATCTRDRRAFHTRLIESVRESGVAYRQLLRTPAFSLLTVASLTLGFALIASTLSVLNAYLVRSMPYPSSDRLYHVLYSPAGQPEPANLESIDWAELGEVVETADASAPTRLFIGSGIDRQELLGLGVAAGSLDLLGVRVAMGRTLVADDFRPESEPVVLIGHALWQDRFGGDPNIIGRSIQVTPASGSESATLLRVVGVLPAGFRYAREHARGPMQFLVPWRTAWPSYMVRLRSGVPVVLAEQRITEAVKGIATSLPDGWSGVRLESVQERYVAGLRTVIVAITVTAAIALVVVCINLAVLMLLRALRRQREIAVRVALGAGHGRIVRMLVTEACLLSGAALLSGLALTTLALRLLAPVIESRLGREAPGGSSAIAVDTTVLVWLAGVGLCVILALSLLPALVPWQHRLADTLRSASRTGTDGPKLRRARSALIALEVAAAVALLTSGGLMVRSVVHMVRTDLGYRTEGIARVRIALPEQSYPDATAYLQFYDQLDDRLAARSIPYALTNFIPFYEYPTQRVEVDDAGGTVLNAGVMIVGDGYLNVLEVPVRQGRGFTADDRVGTEQVALVSESLARRLWPAGDAIGRRVRPSGNESWRTVVGVIGDVRQTFTDEQTLDVYIPFRQAATRYAPLYFRTEGAVADVIATLRTMVADIDPDVLITGDIAGANALDEEAARTLAGPRFLMSLLTGFAIFAAFLALLGVYGATSYSVQQREREVAIRVAIGATRRAIVAVFAREGGAVLGVGIGLGLLAGAATAQLLESQIHGIRPLDLVAFGVTVLLMASAGLLAVCWPALHAAARAPLETLNES